MNEKTPDLVSLHHPIQVAGYTDDEISLVDIWISLTQFRRLFLAVFLVVLGLGIFFVFLVFQEKREIVSTVQIGSIQKENGTELLESPESVLTKINQTFIPVLTQELLAKVEGLGSFETMASNPKSSSILR